MERDVEGEREFEREERNDCEEAGDAEAVFVEAPLRVLLEEARGDFDTRGLGVATLGEGVWLSRGEKELLGEGV